MGIQLLITKDGGNTTMAVLAVTQELQLPERAEPQHT
jgi:hypothetical protein